MRNYSMKNINDLVNLLQEVRSQYQAEYIDATEIKKKEFETLKRIMIPGTPEYAKKQQEIELDFDVAVVAAREKAAKKATEEIEDLKQWELSTVERVDKQSLDIINSLVNIPISTTELQIIAKKYAKNNYFCQRAVVSLAEQNGIPVTDLPLDSSLDTKLSILNGLSKQLDLLLEHYDPTLDTPEASKARFLYLNNDVLNNAVKIYNNGIVDLSEADAVTRSYARIRAVSGQMSKAIAITNSLRNLKKQDSKNALFYRLAMDNSIMPEAYQVAGIADEISEWKNGKATRYAKAIKMTNDIKTTQNVERIQEKLKSYIDKIESGMEQTNEFLSHELAKTYKKNSFIGQALSGLSYAERKTLLGDNSEPQEKQTV